MELICSHLTFSYVKKPSTRLLAFPCRCIHLLRQRPLPRSLRTLHPPMRPDRGSGWSPRWTTSQSSCRSQWVGVSVLGRTRQRKRFTCVLTPCGCMDVEEQGLAGVVWLCDLHVDSALNRTGRLESFSVSACHCCLRRTLYPQQMLQERTNSTCFGFIWSELFQGFHLWWELSCRTFLWTPSTPVSGGSRQSMMFCSSSRSWKVQEWWEFWWIYCEWSTENPVTIAKHPGISAPLQALVPLSTSMLQALRLVLLPALVRVNLRSQVTCQTCCLNSQGFVSILRDSQQTLPCSAEMILQPETTQNRKVGATRQSSRTAESWATNYLRWTVWPTGLTTRI